ncbi:MAG: metal-dependent hydrolase [Pyrinomonadaceae bacterium]|nr:metal-dependent hydrolase [Pyrinomonadaceae bacterium]
MDNLTHSLIGLAASKAGLEKLSPGTTTLCLLAANAPDADIVSLLGGRWTYLHQHRGITHSIAGTLVLALALPLVFYLVDWLLARFRNRPRRIKLRGLLIASVLVSATHPLMDWTNNYGVRFLLPWDSGWSYGDMVFIIDPFLWLALGGSAFLLTARTRLQGAVWLVIAAATSFLVLFGPAVPGGLGNPTPLRIFWTAAVILLVVLFKLDVGKRWGPKIPLAALCAIVIYIGALFGIHAIALRQTELEAASIAKENSEQAIKVAAMPTLANPLQWLSVVETDRATYRFNLKLSGGDRDRANLVRFEKPMGRDAAALANATRDPRSQVFLEFARFPVVNVVGADCITQSLVQLADLRYTEPGRGRGTFSLEVPVECPVQ